MVAGGRQSRIDSIRFEITDLPAGQATAVRVLQVIDDDRASTTDLARAVESDPMLTAQVMRLANSAYYGLSRHVASADFAVSVLGFSTIRSLAAASAAGTLHEGVRLPTDFWEHAAATAVATAMVAPRVMLDRAEAFSLGLLHDLGSAVLCRLDPGGYAYVEAAETGHDRRVAIRLEREQIGIDHAAAGRDVLASWHFPAPTVDAIGDHHERLPGDASSQQRALAAGQVLADLAAVVDTDEAWALALAQRYVADLEAADVSPRVAIDLSRVIREEAVPIAASFHVARSTTANPV